MNKMLSTAPAPPEWRPFVGLGGAKLHAPHLPEPLLIQSTELSDLSDLSINQDA